MTDFYRPGRGGSGGGSSAGGSGLPSNIVTTTLSYTAAAGDFVNADASLAPVAVALPAAPAVGALVAVRVANAELSPPSLHFVKVTPQPGGTIDGLSANLTLGTAQTVTVLEHLGSDDWATVSVPKSGRLLTGGVLPVDALYEPPTVGDWTWSNQSAAWFGPAYAVSWTAGDNVGVVPLEAGQGTGAVQPSKLIGGSRIESDQTGVTNTIPQFDWGSAHGPGGLVTTATADGHGIIFLIQQEEGFGGPTTPPRPGLDVLDYLGDLVLTNGTTQVPFAPDEGTGEDGDLYLFSDNRRLYGPRLEGQWGDGLSLNTPSDAIEVSATSDVPLFHGYAATGGTSDLVGIKDGANRSAFRVGHDGAVITMGTAPADADLEAGQLAMYFTPTAGAPVLHFKGKDSAGAVFTWAIPPS